MDTIKLGKLVLIAGVSLIAFLVLLVVLMMLAS